MAGYRLPLHKVRWTYILLGLNVLIFGLTLLLSTIAQQSLTLAPDLGILEKSGALLNYRVARGEYYRLLTSMFLHADILHLLFNSYALYVLGQDVERLYGSGRFLLIYFLSGLGGSLVSFAWIFGDPRALSVGASGAIFGLIGAEIAFFYIHREMFGTMGRQQLRNLVMVAGFNLILGFTIRIINNQAHIGGLVFGFALGSLLAPKYQAPSVFIPTADGALTLEDSTTIGRRLPMLLAVTIVLAILALIGTQRWSG